METLCRFLGGVDKEGVWYMWPALEGAVNPEWAATPDLSGPRVEGRVGHAICALQASAIIGDSVCTLLVVVSVTP